MSSRSVNSLGNGDHFDSNGLQGSGTTSKGIQFNYQVNLNQNFIIVRTTEHPPKTFRIHLTNPDGSKLNLFEFVDIAEFISKKVISYLHHNTKQRERENLLQSKSWKTLSIQEDQGILDEGLSSRKEIEHHGDFVGQELSPGANKKLQYEGDLEGLYKGFTQGDGPDKAAAKSIRIYHKIISAINKSRKETQEVNIEVGSEARFSTKARERSGSLNSFEDMEVSDPNLKLRPHLSPHLDPLRQPPSSSYQNIGGNRSKVIDSSMNTEKGYLSDQETMGPPFPPIPSHLSQLQNVLKNFELIKQSITSSNMDTYLELLDDLHKRLEHFPAQKKLIVDEIRRIEGLRESLNPMLTDNISNSEFQETFKDFSRKYASVDLPQDLQITLSDLKKKDRQLNDILWSVERSGLDRDIQTILKTLILDSKDRDISKENLDILLRLISQHIKIGGLEQQEDNTIAILKDNLLDNPKNKLGLDSTIEIFEKKIELLNESRRVEQRNEFFAQALSQFKQEHQDILRVNLPLEEKTRALSSLLVKINEKTDEFLTILDNGTIAGESTERGILPQYKSLLENTKKDLEKLDKISEVINTLDVEEPNRRIRHRPSQYNQDLVTSIQDLNGFLKAVGYPTFTTSSRDLSSLTQVLQLLNQTLKSSQLEEKIYDFLSHIDREKILLEDFIKKADINSFTDYDKGISSIFSPIDAFKYDNQIEGIYGICDINRQFQSLNNLETLKTLETLIQRLRHTLESVPEQALSHKQGQDLLVQMQAVQTAVKVQRSLTDHTLDIRDVIDLKTMQEAVHSNLGFTVVENIQERIAQNNETRLRTAQTEKQRESALHLLRTSATKSLEEISPKVENFSKFTLEDFQNKEREFDLGISTLETSIDQLSRYNEKDITGLLKERLHSLEVLKAQLTMITREYLNYANPQDTTFEEIVVEDEGSLRYELIDLEDDDRTLSSESSSINASLNLLESLTKHERRLPKSSFRMFTTSENKLLEKSKVSESLWRTTQTDLSRSLEEIRRGIQDIKSSKHILLEASLKEIESQLISIKKTIDELNNITSPLLIKEKEEQLKALSSLQYFLIAYQSVSINPDLISSEIVDKLKLRSDLLPSETGIEKYQNALTISEAKKARPDVSSLSLEDIETIRSRIADINERSLPENFHDMFIQLTKDLGTRERALKRESLEQEYREIQSLFSSYEESNYNPYATSDSDHVFTRFECICKLNRILNDLEKINAESRLHDSPSKAVKSLRLSSRKDEDPYDSDRSDQSATETFRDQVTDLISTIKKSASVPKEEREFSPIPSQGSSIHNLEEEEEEEDNTELLVVDPKQTTNIDSQNSTDSLLFVTPSKKEDETLRPTQEILKIKKEKLKKLKLAYEYLLPVSVTIDDNSAESLILSLGGSVIEPKEQKVDQKVLKRCLTVLNRPNYSNLVLVGEPGTGKTTIIASIAQHMKKSGNNKKIYSLDVSRLVSGTSYRGQFEERLNKVLDAVEKDGGILFIDEIHQLMKAGQTEGSSGAADILKTRMTTGKLCIIGATTRTEYDETIAKTTAFERRIGIAEMSQMSCKEAFRALKKRFPKTYEKKYPDLKISDGAYYLAVEFASRYMRDALPAAPEQLLNDAVAEFKTEHPTEDLLTAQHLAKILNTAAFKKTISENEKKNLLAKIDSLNLRRERFQTYHKEEAPRYIIEGDEEDEKKMLSSWEQKVDQTFPDSFDELDDLYLIAESMDIGNESGSFRDSQLSSISIEQADHRDRENQDILEEDEEITSQIAQYENALKTKIDDAEKILDKIELEEPEEDEVEGLTEVEPSLQGLKDKLEALEKAFVQKLKDSLDENVYLQSKTTFKEIEAEFNQMEDDESEGYLWLDSRDTFNQYKKEFEEASSQIKATLELAYSSSPIREFLTLKAKAENPETPLTPTQKKNLQKTFPTLDFSTKERSLQAIKIKYKSIEDKKDFILRVQSKLADCLQMTSLDTQIEETILKILQLGINAKIDDYVNALFDLKISPDCPAEVRAIIQDILHLNVERQDEAILNLVMTGPSSTQTSKGKTAKKEEQVSSQVKVILEAGPTQIGSTIRTQQEQLRQSIRTLESDLATIEQQASEIEDITIQPQYRRFFAQEIRNGNLSQVRIKLIDEAKLSVIQAEEFQNLLLQEATLKAKINAFKSLKGNLKSGAQLAEERKADKVKRQKEGLEIDKAQLKAMESTNAFTLQQLEGQSRLIHLGGETNNLLARIGISIEQNSRLIDSSIHLQQEHLNMMGRFINRTTLDMEDKISSLQDHTGKLSSMLQDYRTRISENEATIKSLTSQLQSQGKEAERAIQTLQQQNKELITHLQTLGSNLAQANETLLKHGFRLEAQHLHLQKHDHQILNLETRLQSIIDENESTGKLLESILGYCGLAEDTESTTLSTQDKIKRIEQATSILQQKKDSLSESAMSGEDQTRLNFSSIMETLSKEKIELEQSLEKFGKAHKVALNAAEETSQATASIKQMGAIVEIQSQDLLQEARTKWQISKVKFQETLESLEQARSQLDETSVSDVSSVIALANLYKQQIEYMNSEIEKNARDLEDHLDDTFQERYLDYKTQMQSMQDLLDQGLKAIQSPTAAKAYFESCNKRIELLNQDLQSKDENAFLEIMELMKSKEEVANRIMLDLEALPSQLTDLRDPKLAQEALTNAKRELQSLQESIDSFDQSIAFDLESNVLTAQLSTSIEQNDIRKQLEELERTKATTLANLKQKKEDAERAIAEAKKRIETTSLDTSGLARIIDAQSEFERTVKDLQSLINSQVQDAEERIEQAKIGAQTQYDAFIESLGGLNLSSLSIPDLSEKVKELNEQIQIYQKEIDTQSRSASKGIDSHLFSQTEAYEEHLLKIQALLDSALEQRLVLETTQIDDLLKQIDEKQIAVETNNQDIIAKLELQLQSLGEIEFPDEERLKGLSINVNQLKSRVAGTISRLENQEKLVKEFEQQNRALGTILDESRDDISDLNNSVRDLEKSVAKLQKNLDSKESELQRLREQLDNLDKVRESKEDVQGLHDSIQSHNEEVEALTRQFKLKQSELEEAKSKLPTSPLGEVKTFDTEAWNQLQQDIALHNQAVKSLNQLQTQQQQSLKEASEALGSIKAPENPEIDISRLRTLAQTLAEQQQTLKQTYNERILSFKKDIETCESLRSQIPTVTTTETVIPNIKELEELEHQTRLKLENAQKQLDQSLQAYESQINAIEQKASTLERDKERVDALVEQSREYQLHIDEELRTLSDLESKASIRKQGLETSFLSISDAIQQLSRSLEGTVESYDTSHAFSKASQITSLKQQITLKIDEFKKLEDELTEKQKLYDLSLKRLESHISKIQEAVSAEVSSVDTSSLKADLETFKKQKKLLESNNQKLSSEIANLQFQTEMLASKRQLIELQTTSLQSAREDATLSLARADKTLTEGLLAESGLREDIQCLNTAKGLLENEISKAKSNQTTLASRLSSLTAETSRLKSVNTKAVDDERAVNRTLGESYGLDLDTSTILAKQQELASLVADFNLQKQSLELTERSISDQITLLRLNLPKPSEDTEVVSSPITDKKELERQIEDLQRKNNEVEQQKLELAGLSATLKQQSADISQLSDRQKATLELAKLEIDRKTRLKNSYEEEESRALTELKDLRSKNDSLESDIRKLQSSLAPSHDERVTTDLKSTLEEISRLKARNIESKRQLEEQAAAFKSQIEQKSKQLEQDAKQQEDALSTAFSQLSHIRLHRFDSEVNRQLRELQRSHEALDELSLSTSKRIKEEISKKQAKIDELKKSFDDLLISANQREEDLAQKQDEMKDLIGNLERELSEINGLSIPAASTGIESGLQDSFSILFKMIQSLKDKQVTQEDLTKLQTDLDITIQTNKALTDEKLSQLQADLEKKVDTNTLARLELEEAIKYCNALDIPRDLDLDIIERLQDQIKGPTIDLVDFRHQLDTLKATTVKAYYKESFKSLNENRFITEKDLKKIWNFISTINTAEDIDIISSINKFELLLDKAQRNAIICQQLYIDITASPLQTLYSSKYQEIMFTLTNDHLNKKDLLKAKDSISEALSKVELARIKELHELKSGFGEYQEMALNALKTKIASKIDLIQRIDTQFAIEDYSGYDFQQLTDLEIQLDGTLQELTSKIIRKDFSSLEEQLEKLNLLPDQIEFLELQLQTEIEKQRLSKADVDKKLEQIEDTLTNHGDAIEDQYQQIQELNRKLQIVQTADSTRMQTFMKRAIDKLSSGITPEVFNKACCPRATTVDPGSRVNHLNIYGLMTFDIRLRKYQLSRDFTLSDFCTGIQNIKAHYIHSDLNTRHGTKFFEEFGEALNFINLSIKTLDIVREWSENEGIVLSGIDATVEKEARKAMKAMVASINILWKNLSTEQQISFCNNYPELSLSLGYKTKLDEVWRELPLNDQIKFATDFPDLCHTFRYEESIVQKFDTLKIQPKIDLYKNCQNHTIKQLFKDNIRDKWLQLRPQTRREVYDKNPTLRLELSLILQPGDPKK